MGSSLTIAVPKGRVLKSLCPLLERAGLNTEPLTRDDRTLIRHDETRNLRYLLLKPDDVPTYVEFGAADLGVVGRDVLLERQYDLYVPVDLEIGRCRMVVAAPMESSEPKGRAFRVGTKYPNIAERYFRARGHVEIVLVQGSVELAPLTGLVDQIVDLVETGETLRQNGLVERETLFEITSVVVANRAGLKLKQPAIRKLLERLESAVSAG